MVNDASKSDMDQEDEKKEKWTYRNWIIAISALITMLSFAALLFIIPLILDPAFATLRADFAPDPVECSVTSSQMLIGLSNCSWTSCVEGCTRDLFKCYQIQVRYLDSEAAEHDGYLMVNVRACGYPPKVDCERFFTYFGRNDFGFTFPCHYSRENNSIVVPEYNRSTQKNQIVLGCIPIFIMCVSITALIISIHLDRRAQRKRRSEIEISEENLIQEEDLDSFTQSPERRAPDGLGLHSIPEQFQMEPLKRPLQDHSQSPVLKKRIKHPF